MSLPEQPLAIDSHPLVGQESNRDSAINVLATFLTTLTIFGIFLIQGVMIARILGPLGRGEFGTALYFPRDILLYAGLLGGIEIVNSFAVQRTIDLRSLKHSAAQLGFISGMITAVVAFLVSVVVLSCVGKIYLIPYCLLCCLFVPWEHMQLTISAVDRGAGRFNDYNINRLIYAALFPILLAIVFGLNLDQQLPFSPLLLVCLSFVLARIVGLWPTVRGVNLWSALTQSQTKEKTDLQNKRSEDGDSASVPGPWDLLKQGRLYALSMLASELFERLDIFLIVAIASVELSGQYFVAVPAAAMLTVAPNALAVFTFNVGADPNRTVRLKQALLVLVGTILFQIASAILFSLIAPKLILLMYGEPFAAAIPFVLWLIPAAAIKGYLQAADGYLKGRNLPLIGVRARLISILIMLAFVWLVYHDILLIPYDKLVSIPMAACVGQAVSMLLITSSVILDLVRQQRDQIPTQDSREVQK